MLVFQLAAHEQHPSTCFSLALLHLQNPPVPYRVFDV